MVNENQLPICQTWIQVQIVGLTISQITSSGLSHCVSNVFLDLTFLEIETQAPCSLEMN